MRRLELAGGAVARELLHSRPRGAVGERFRGPR
jgi:hypothetical protein